MTPLEIIAAIFAALVLIKLIILSINPKKWFKLVKPVMNNIEKVKYVYLIFAGVIGYYIFESGMTIVQVSAVLFFSSLLISLSIFRYMKPIFKHAKKTVDKGFWKEFWLEILIWAGICVWTLVTIFW